jgi:hypothetical protein
MFPIAPGVHCTWTTVSSYVPHCPLRALQNRGALLAPLLERLAGADWDAAGRAALALWELCYDEAMGNNFLLLQVSQGWR